MSCLVFFTACKGELCIRVGSTSPEYLYPTPPPYSSHKLNVVLISTKLFTELTSYNVILMSRYIFKLTRLVHKELPNPHLIFATKS